MALTPEQRKVVDAITGHYVVLAGPGSGKTYTITEKIAHLFEREVIPEPYGLLALTFTNSAARVMRDRLRSKGFHHWDRVWIGTFHSFGKYVLSSYGSEVGVAEDFEIADADVTRALLREIIQGRNLDLREWDEAERIGRLKRRGIYPGTGDDDLPSEVQALYADYQEELASKGLVDFGDLIALSVTLLQQSEFVRRAYTNFFRYILVDEFQDTDQQQLELVRILAEPALGSTVVGDDDQSIFGWRGALRKNVFRIKEVLGSRELTMGANFRSDQVIVEAAEKVIGHDPDRAEKELTSVSKNRGRLYRREFEDPEAEAAGICRWIEESIDEGEVEDLGDISVITRTRFRAESILAALDARKIPWFNRARLGFQESWETSLALSVFELANDTKSSTFLNGVLKAIEDGGLAYRLGGIDALDVALELRDCLLDAEFEALGPKDLEQILEASGVTRIVDAVASGSTDRKRRLANIALLIQDIRSLSEEQSLFLPEVFERLSGRGAVQVLSGHEAKGTEFPVVFFAGLEDDILPHYRSHDSEERLSEERRVFYVGLTRAERTAYLTYASQRQFNGRIWKRQPSRFLEHIPDEYFSELP